MSEDVEHDHEAEDETSLVAQLARQLRGLLDRIDARELDTDYETRTRIEGGVIALEAILDQLTDEDDLDDEHEDEPLTERESDAFEEIAKRMRSE